MEENNNKDDKIKTRQGSGYLKQLYSTARVTAGSTHTNLKNLTTFLVNLVPVDKVDASELQVRTHFDDAEVQALAHSIKLHGVLQPILVVQDGDRYKVIAGERRLRASKLAGMERIPARVMNTDDKATHEIALRENLDRVDLHPVEEGEAYVSLLKAGAYASYDAIAQGFGKPKSRVTECIGFTKLPSLTKEELLRTGLKNRSLLRNLLNVEPDKHIDMIREAVGNDEVLAKANISVDSDNSVLKTAKEKKEKPVFNFQIDEKGFSIPSFRWKIGEGKEKMIAFRDAMLNLLSETEKKF
ncbi:MAG: ParB/RepB/Spo0J family partition protein [Xanthomonadaceae bacterium]|nr:ParB/RepB/Spo0J family partition protein [Xanthomonadaceae bacterium]